MVYVGVVCFLLIVVIGSLLNRGLPDCISDVYYKMSYWFSILMVVMALCFMPSMLDVTSEDCKFLAFLVCGGIAFVGVAPNYKDESEGDIHKISAMLSCVCSIAWTTCVAPYYLLTLTICIVSLFDRKRWLFWLELPCFVMVIASMLQKC